MTNLTNGNMVGSFKTHIEKNIWLYLISLFCICTGIVIGVYTAKYLSGNEKNVMVQWIDQSIRSLQSDKVSLNTIFLESVRTYLPMIVIIWVFGLTIIGFPVILIMNIVKGYTLGFTFSFLISSFGAKGLGVCILNLLLKNIIFIPCIMVCSVFAMEFSLNLIRSKEKSWTSNIVSSIASYSMSFLGIVLIMFIGFLIETIVYPLTVKSMISMVILP